MRAPSYKYSEIEEDHPIPLLHRKLVHADNALIAKVRLEKGCHVNLHHHESEQIAMVMSGHVRWILGPEGPDQYTQEMRGGEVLQLRSNFPHGIDALEDSEIIDVLSPHGLMGVDSQGS